MDTVPAQTGQASIRAPDDRPAMLLPRATGVILLLYSGFHMTLGLWVPQFPWLLTGILLIIGATAMIACRSWSRIVVYASALAAGAVGLIGQVSAAGDAHADIPLAVIIWSLWTSLWLAVAYLGARYLPEAEDGGFEFTWPSLPTRREKPPITARTDRAPG